MKVLKHPFHLLAILAGAGAVAVVLWRVDDPSGGHFAAYTGFMVAFLAAVDLARRLGLDPKDDPASGDRGEIR